MKAISTVYGAYLSLLITFLILTSLWISLIRYENTFITETNQQISKLETLINRPKLAIQWLSNKTLNLYIFTTKPVHIKYLIIESNNMIEFIPIDKEITNLGLIKVMDYYNGEKIRVGIILSDGTIIFHDPLKDPIFTKSVDTDYLFLSNKTLEESNSYNIGITLNKMNTYVNPLIGWAFNKSTIIINDNRLYYLIPFVFNFNRTVKDLIYSTSYPNIIVDSGGFFDYDEGKWVRNIEFGNTGDPDYVSYVKITYEDGSSRTIEIGEATLNLLASYSYIDHSSKYDINITFYSKITKVSVRVVDNGVAYEFKVNITSWAIIDLKPRGYIFDNFSCRLIVDYWYKVLHGEDVYPPDPGSRVISVVHGFGYESSFKSMSEPKSRVVYIDLAPGGHEVYEPVFEIRFYKYQVLVGTNTKPPVLENVGVPYISYDVYQPVMNTIYPIDTTFVRLGNNTASINYNNYLFPGMNKLNVKVLMPFMYAINISQPDPTLPPYLVLFTTRDPQEILDINEGNRFLTGLGLIEINTTITFKYKSAVYYPGDVWYTIYNAGDTITANKNMVIIPLEGPYKGMEYYVWVAQWKLLNR